MHNYGVSPENVRMALAIGLIVSILMYERWRLTSGAAWVAAYLALFVERPLYIVTTVALALATYYLVERVIARRMFLFGRRHLVNGAVSHDFSAHHRVREVLERASHAVAGG